MQMNILFGLVVSVFYLLSTFMINKYSTEKKTPKQMVMDSCVVFLTVIGSSFIMEFAGLTGQKGGSVTAAFTSKPEF